MPRLGKNKYFLANFKAVSVAPLFFRLLSLRNIFNQIEWHRNIDHIDSKRQFFPPATTVISKAYVYYVPPMYAYCGSKSSDVTVAHASRQIKILQHHSINPL